MLVLLSIIIVVVVSSLGVRCIGGILLSIVRILSVVGFLRISCILGIFCLLSTTRLVLLGISVVPSLGICTISRVLLSGAPCSILGVFRIVVIVVSRSILSILRVVLGVVVVIVSHSILGIFRFVLGIVVIARLLSIAGLVLLGIIVVISSPLGIGSIGCVLLVLVVIASCLGISCFACIVLCISPSVSLCPSCAFLADETAGSNGTLVDTSAVCFCEVTGDEVGEAAASWRGGCGRHACQESCDDDEVMHFEDGILFAKGFNGLRK